MVRSGCFPWIEMTNENRPVTNDRKLREFWFPNISGRENCATFAFPIYRDEKTARLLLSRYIGTGKLREFWRPDISALQNCLRDRSETVPETVSETLFVVLHSITD